ncbi:XdhC family protein [Haloferula sp.]|uniref:XdhC family protein n=1 Tax=Haloferula sp. TaxID=2497595 RepID=UPI003C7276C9
MDEISRGATKEDVMDGVWEQVVKLRAAGVAFVLVTITQARGSVPGVLGAKALVTAEGLVGGNLGGGKVEARAVAQAQEMLGGDERVISVLWNLQRDVGMTCGGEMGFLFEHAPAEVGWHVVVFGAGHVSQALVRVLAGLRCVVEVVDERAEWLARLPVAGNVRRHEVAAFVDGLQWVKPTSFVLSITKGHAADRPVLREVLRRFPDIPYLGVIGSASKRAVLTRELMEDGIEVELLDRLVCPLGLPIGGNDPEEIAISIAAQLLQRRG